MFSRSPVRFLEERTRLRNATVEELDLAHVGTQQSNPERIIERSRKLKGLVGVFRRLCQPVLEDCSIRKLVERAHDRLGLPELTPYGEGLLRIHPGSGRVSRVQHDAGHGVQGVRTSNLGPRIGEAESALEPCTPLSELTRQVPEVPERGSESKSARRILRL